MFYKSTYALVQSNNGTLPLRQNCMIKFAEKKRKTLSVTEFKLYEQYSQLIQEEVKHSKFPPRQIIVTEGSHFDTESLSHLIRNYGK